MGYALLAIGVLAVFALVFFLVTNVFRSPSTASVKVPNVVNLTEADAKTQIEGAGFTFASTPAVSDTVPAGQVIKQDPAADSLAEPKTTVTVTVSSGSDQAQVPDVTNMTQEEARKAIEGAGLRVGNVTTEDSTTVAKDRVIRSDPAAGQALPKDSQVNLVLASGNVTVPDVRGKTQLEAQNILGDLGLTYNIVQEPSSKDEGTVIKQDKVDVTVPVGSPITLTVATPLPTTSTSSSTTTTTPPTTPTGTGTPTGSGTTPP
jgi:serine/threonine-protein kinase